jgi:hypothetical protein
MVSPPAGRPIFRVTIDRGPYQWPLQSPHVPRRGGHHRAGGHAMATAMASHGH